MQIDPNRFRGCLLGLAVGDAVGTAVEFMPRGSFPKVVDMTGGGPFKLLPGQWTDDTSMALCLAISLISRKSFDAVDQMDRYWDWYQNGTLSSTGRCFDIGNTVSEALHRYKRTGDPFSGSTAPLKAGNGCLMRLAPIPMYYFPDLDQILHFAGESSRTTHGARECVDACKLFAEMLFRALSGAGRDEVLFNCTVQVESPSIREIAGGKYCQKNISQIKGSGYVVECLEAALWCFYQTGTFEAAVLQAANLGDDADTTAAICGQIAGAYYGETNIPVKWLERLHMRDEISYIAEQLSEIGA
jgi:ADP-ribosyl-[dinitrogen reductase] hydrolase